MGIAKICFHHYWLFCWKVSSIFSAVASANHACCCFWYNSGTIITWSNVDTILSTTMQLLTQSIDQKLNPQVKPYPSRWAIGYLSWLWLKCLVLEQISGAAPVYWITKQPMVSQLAWSIIWQSSLADWHVLEQGQLGSLTSRAWFIPKIYYLSRYSSLLWDNHVSTIVSLPSTCGDRTWFSH